MAYARQVELVELSKSRPLRPRNTGYTPRESILGAASATPPGFRAASGSTSSSSPTPPASPASSSPSGSPASREASRGDPSPYVRGSAGSGKKAEKRPLEAKERLTEREHSTSDVDDIATAQLARVLTAASVGYTTPTESTDSDAAAVSNLSVENREEIFRHCLGASTVDVDELRRIVWAHGVPTATWARPLAWKLLTGYLPPDRGDWSNTLASARARYWAAVHDATVDPSARPVDGDHPLSDDVSSQWREFFLDADVRTLIARDAHRTHADLQRATAIREPLERLLFVFAKRHPSVGYRQGMNELAAPFLLVFADDRGADSSDMEADAYFCFEAVMTEMGPCYIPGDAATDGISIQLRELQALLRIKDPHLEGHLERLGVDPRFYGLRWIRLWLSQEFPLPDCLSLWDSFLTAEVRLPWIRYVCVAMLTRIRERLLNADFTECMKTLLNYPACDISELLRIADKLRTSNAVIVRTARR